MERRRASRAGLILASVLAALVSRAATAQASSAARQWDEQLLAAIRVDIPKPPAHARNLFHLSVAMWDAWAAFDARAQGVISTEKMSSANPSADRNQAISFAAYRLLKYRFPVGFTDVDGNPCHPNAVASQAAFDAQMDALGYDKTFTSTSGATPAALGNRIAAAVIAFGQTDGANEGSGLCYPDDTGYASANPPLVFKLPGVGQLVDANRWQPLAFDYLVLQNGIVIGGAVQRFIGVGWNDVRPFALTPAQVTPATGLYLDPGPPPQLGGVGDDVLKAAILDDLRFSSEADPADPTTVDISPGAAHFNNPLGSDAGTGHPYNPSTGQPYPPNIVNRADYVRVSAQFWADGPHSETPPGHWNVIANSVSDAFAPGTKRIGGTGPAVDDLEWDVKTYLAVNGALHDAAVWCWGTKNHYDAARPITLVRYMGSLGQSSDPSAPSYNAQGLPLEPGVVELITSETTAPGGRHANLAGYGGEIAVRAWLGSPPDIHTQVGGVGWIRAVTWMPYQLNTFVTPPFPGYPSGHSSYSRAAAEVLTQLTGSAFFPGGLGSFVAAQNQYLAFELGPSATVTLQWATYYDAADSAGLSRRMGGIHPYYDDYTSRIAGSQIGLNAWAKARAQFAANPQPVPALGDHGSRVTLLAMLLLLGGLRRSTSPRWLGGH
jgi:hypothetical protein